MILNIDITTDLEFRIREEAAKQGIDVSQYVVSALQDRFRSAGAKEARLTAEESQRLEEINRGLSQTQWTRYYDLVAKRQRDNLSDDEYAELVATSDRIEELNARRMECLAELSRLRGVTLPQLLHQFGIASPRVI